jgi:site-specific recombinase XerD
MQTPKSLPQLTQRQIDRVPREIADAAGLPKDLDPCHCFRRNLATQLDKEGVSSATIMKLGGWKTPAMVMHYTATTKATLREAANLLGRKIAEAKAETA